MTATETRIWLADEGDAPAAASTFGWVPWLVLGCLIALFAGGFALLSILRHLAYQSHAFDLGNMDQAVWTTLHGQPLRFTDMQVGHRVLTSRLAIHVEPLLVALSPLYLMRSGPLPLLVVQALVVSLGAIPAYLLARDALGKPYLALAFPLAYLLHPSLQNALLDDFHAVTMSSALLLWALLFAWRGNLPGFAVSSLLAASTKEEVALLVAMMSVLLVRRSPAAAALTACFGVSWFLLCVTTIIPHVNPAGHSPYLARYHYLGSGLVGVLHGIVTRPHTVLAVLTSQPRLDYLVALLHPLGWASLLGLPVLLLALPSLAINMLSSDPTMYSGFYQYSAEVVPFVIAAGAVGVGRLTRLAPGAGVAAHRALPAVLCALVLVGSLVDARRYGFSPLSEGYVVPSVGQHQRLENKLLHVIPAGAVVAAADEIEPHLSHRRWVYLLPTVHPANGPAARYIALDASVPSLPVTPQTVRHAAVRALAHGYGVVRAADGVLILRQGGGRKKLPSSFFSFVFQRAHRVPSQPPGWGSIDLVGVTVHPRSARLTRSRPAISIETYWRLTAGIPRGAQIAVYCSPVYRGAHPSFSPAWRVERDSPTLDWLPLDSWPRGRTIHAAFVPMVPDVHGYGKVDVALAVRGAGRLHGAQPKATVQGEPLLLRLATLSVGY